MPKRSKAILERSKLRIPGYPLVAETSVARFPSGKENLVGLKCRFQLYHVDTGETLVRYDIHHGKDHHCHFLGKERVYDWHGVEELFDDFRRDIEQVKRLLREGSI